MQLVALLIFQFFGTVLILIPLIFHARHRNVAVICLCLLLAISNGIYFLNGLVWNGPPGPNAPLMRGYCDVSGRILSIQGPSLLGCSIAILRQLARILSSKGASALSGLRRTRQAQEDLATIFLVPLIIVTVNLGLFREPRYTIYEFIGCYPSYIANTPLRLISDIWLPVMALASAYYAVLIIYSLNQKRKAFREIIRNSQSGLDINRFIRLLSLALLSIAVILPIVLYTFIDSVNYINWHSTYRPNGNFSIIFINPFSMRMRNIDVWNQWLAALLSIVCAGIFGIGKEAFNNYRNWFYHVPGSQSAVDYLRRSTSQLSKRLSSSVGSFFTASKIGSRYSQSSYKEGMPLTEITEIDVASMDSSAGASSRRAGTGVKQTLADMADLEALSGNAHEQQSFKMQTRIWNNVEGTGSLPSPNKIKVEHDTLQNSSYVESERERERARH